MLNVTLSPTSCGPTSNHSQPLSSPLPPKSSFAKWIKLSPQEIEPFRSRSAKNCHHKFEHCCVGQCRKPANKKDLQDVLWKWNEKRLGAEPLAKLADVLDQLERRRKAVIDHEGVVPLVGNDPQNKITKTTATTSSSSLSSSTCKISYYGDSLTMEQTFATTCELMKWAIP